MIPTCKSQGMTQFIVEKLIFGGDIGVFLAPDRLFSAIFSGTHIFFIQNPIKFQKIIQILRNWVIPQSIQQRRTSVNFRKIGKKIKELGLPAKKRYLSPKICKIAQNRQKMAKMLKQKKLFKSHNFFALLSTKKIFATIIVQKLTFQGGVLP